MAHAQELVRADNERLRRLTEEVPGLLSEQATLHMEGAPALVKPINEGGTAATPVRSLWQTVSIGVRMLLDLTWAMRRPGMVSAVTGVQW
ncbi:hypothetical protein ABIE51_002465 [Lysobacter sp. OAE881]|uniref:hypothetical protein n=1 Tax=Lysobacter sp. OAE881 TaxID=2663813 RepID=UPI0017896228